MALPLSMYRDALDRGVQIVRDQWTAATVDQRNPTGGVSNMAIMADGRAVMTLFSSPTCFYSHRTRLVMAEKNINIEIVTIEGADMPEDLLDLNPYHSVPTLVDRDLVLYDSRVIIEYLDERFPHPPLMPVDPVTRAQFRLALYRIEKDWYSLAEQIEDAAERRQATRARKILQESIMASADVFAAKMYFLSDDFSLVDCTIAPILWRLPMYGIQLDGPAQPILRYMDEVFSRRSFRESLTEHEHEMQQ